MASKVASDLPSVDRFGKNFGGFMAYGQVKVYQVSANLVHRELRNATFGGKKCQPQLHCRTLVLTFTRRMAQNCQAFRDSPIMPLRRSPLEMRRHHAGSGGGGGGVVATHRVFARGRRLLKASLKTVTTFL